MPVAEQQMAQWRPTTGDAHSDRVKAELPQQRGERATRVEVQVITQRRRQRLDAIPGQHAPGRGWGREQQPPPRGEHPPDLRQPVTRVSDVLDHFAGPDELERTVPERKRTIEGDPDKVQRGVPPARPDQCRLGDVRADDGIDRLGQHPGEMAVAASEVKGAVRAVRMGEQEALAQRQVGRTG